MLLLCNSREESLGAARCDLAGCAPNPAFFEKQARGRPFGKGWDQMRHVVEVKARVERDGEVSYGAGYRIYKTRSEAHELLFQIRCHIADGVPHRAKTGAVVSVLSVRSYEADAETDDEARRLVQSGAARLLNQAATGQDAA
jgi:hypothetical protein